MSSMPESLLSIVNERRSSYLKSVRLLFLSFATLLAFQFIVFDPYLSATSQLVETEQSEFRLNAMRRNVESRQAAYAAMQPRIEEAMEQGLANLMSNLAQDLEVLTYQIAPYLPDDLKPIPEDSLLEEPRMQMQMQASAMPQPSGLTRLRVKLSDETVSRLSETQSWNQIREQLNQAIQEQLIAPRFSEYNSEIQRAIGKELQAIRSASDWAPADLDALPEDLRELWREVESASQAALRNLEAFVIEKPQNDRWWWSASGKAGARRLELNRSVSLLSDLKGQFGYEALIGSLRSQLQALEDTTQLLTEEQKEIQEDFASFQETISQLLGPLDWLPLNMDDLVSLMPLLVAVSFGGGSSWIVVKRSQYSEILNTASKKSDAVRGLGFALSLPNSRERVQGYVFVGVALASAWVVYANLKLTAFARVVLSSESVSLRNGFASAAFLNWGVSFALLVLCLGVALRRIR